MKEIYDVHELVEKFMAGDTTLAEEQYLYNYFADRHIAADLLPYRDLFLGLGSIQETDHGEAVRPVRRHRRWMVAAAAIASFVLVAAALWVNAEQNYSVAYVYGKKTTDEATIRAEVSRTMDAIDQQGSNTIDGQLHDVLMTDQ